MSRAICGIFMFLLCLSAIVQAQSYKIITRAQGRGNDYYEARKQAYRAAIEEAYGVRVESFSKVQNFELIEDTIYTTSEGFIRRVSKEEVGQEYGAYLVTLYNVEVSESVSSMQDEFARIANKLQRLNYPSIGIDRRGVDYGFVNAMEYFLLNEIGIRLLNNIQSCELIIQPHVETVAEGKVQKLFVQGKIVNQNDEIAANCLEFQVSYFAGGDKEYAAKILTATLLSRLDFYPILRVANVLSYNQASGEIPKMIQSLPPVVYCVLKTYSGGTANYDARSKVNLTTLGTLLEDTGSFRVNQVDEVQRILEVSYGGAPQVVRISVAVQGPSQANKGDSITYGVVAQNIGNSPANNVQVKIQMPAGMKFLNSANGSKDQWNLGSLSPGQSVQNTYNFKIQQTGTFTFYAEVYVQGQRVAEGNCSTRVQTETIPQPADLAISVQGPEETCTGESVDYVVIVQNTGGAAASNVAVSVEMQGMKFERCTSGNLAKWNIGTLSPGESRSCTYTFVAQTAGTCTLYANLRAKGIKNKQARCTTKVSFGSVTGSLIYLMMSDKIDAGPIDGTDIGFMQTLGQGGWYGDIEIADGYLYLMKDDSLYATTIEGYEKGALQLLGQGGWKGDIEIADGYLYLIKDGSLYATTITGYEKGPLKLLGQGGWNGDLEIYGGYLYLMKDETVYRTTIVGYEKGALEMIEKGGWYGDLEIGDGYIYLMNKNTLWAATYDGYNRSPLQPIAEGWSGDFEIGE